MGASFVITTLRVTEGSMCFPDLDMVVGITGGDYAERDKFFPWESELMPQYMIPAALAGEGTKP